MMADVPPDDRGPLVGRAAELDRLAGLVGLAGPRGPEHPDASARSGAVLLSGDAGVGKTRLLVELRDHAESQGWRVMVGHCVDFGESALPYLPFSEAFGRLASDSPGLAASLVAAGPGVARLMPARRLLGDGQQVPAGSESEHPERATTTPDRIDRADLFESVHASLEHLARAAPLLLLVEDVHWADQSTREMVSFLFSRGFEGPVSLVASYRSDDLHRRHPLRTTAAEWARLPGVSRLELGRLPDASVRDLVRTLHPRPLPDHAVRGIVERAEGNAFFTEELVAAAEAGAGALPGGLADLLLVRLDQLDEGGRQVVRAAAVSGRRVSHDLLARVSGVDSSELDAALRGAVERNVLVPAGGDGYAFRHALLAEAVYDDLLPGERVRLHASYVEALTSRDIEGTAAELARHARAANDLPTAARASVAAGDEAMAVAGPDEAARHFETALELVSDPTVAGSLGTDVSIVDLVVRACDASVVAGQVFRAVALAQHQLAQLDRSAGPDDRARLLQALAASAILGDTGVDVLAVTTEALQLVPGHPPSALSAQLMALHARANGDRRRDDDAARWAAKALALGQELGLASVVADASTTLARLDERAGDPESSRQLLEQTVAQARAAGEVGAELRGLFNLGGLHYEYARHGEALEVYLSSARRAVEAGRPWSPYGLDSRVMAGLVTYVTGDWDQSVSILDTQAEAPGEMASAYLASAGLAVAAGRGDLVALDVLPRLRPWWDKEGLVAILVGGAAIDLHGDADELASAIASHDETVEAVGALWQRPTFQARIRLSALLLGQLNAAAGRPGVNDRDALAARGEELADIAVQVAAGQSELAWGHGPEGQAWEARAAAEHARLRWLTGVDPPGENELVASWARAVELFEAFGHVFEVARSRARLGAVLRATGQAGAAGDVVALANTTARHLGAQPLLRELRSVGGTASTPAGSGTGGDSRRDEPLTAREHEVLALVAQGRSNKEIAGQLFISAKTVSVHVSNILAKLGAAGRTEAVAVARRRGDLD